MSPVQVLRTALRSLRGNRVRTALTALGTIIGVASVVVVLAVGEGASADVEGRIRSMGTNLLTIRPGTGGFGPVRSGSVQTLTLKDAEALAGISGVVAVAPEVDGMAQIRHLTENTNAKVIGVTGTYLGIRNLEIASGLSFDVVDLQQRRRIAILGANVAQDLFADESPVGQRIQIRGVPFRVVGALTAVGESGFGSADDNVLVPLSTHQGVLFGQDHLSSIGLQVEHEDLTDAVQARIEQLLRLRHRLRSDQEDDFFVRSQTEMLKTMSAITGTLTALLGAVALVSLIVGGIGIMNIMLASVRERTREIGVRMAVGARRRDILLQFLAEAVVVSLGGGLVGLMLGLGGARAVAHFAGWSVVVPPYAVALALGVSLTVGVVFGVAPARRAAQLDPVEALRTE